MPTLYFRTLKWEVYVYILPYPLQSFGNIIPKCEWQVGAYFSRRCKGLGGIDLKLAEKFCIKCATKRRDCGSSFAVLGVCASLGGQ